MNDDIPGRVRAVEQKLAAVAQRAEDHETDIRSLAPLVIAEQLLKERLDNVREDVKDIHAGVDKLAQELAEDRKDRRNGQEVRRQELKDNADRIAQSQEDLRKEKRRGFYILAAAIIGSAGTVIATFAH